MSLIRMFLFGFFLPIFVLAEDKILIISHHYAQPFFIELQARTFKKFLRDEYEFVVFNDAKTPVLEEEINRLCMEQGIRCIRIHPEIHNRPYLFRLPGEDYNHPCIRCANVVQYSLDVLGCEYPGKVVIIDSDMFPIQPVSFLEIMGDSDLVAVPQSRDNGVFYMWNGLIIFNMQTLPDKKMINFNCGRVNDTPVDAGGYTYYYLDQYKDQIRVKWIGAEFLADTIMNYRRGQLDRKLYHLIPLIDSNPPENMETFVEGKFLHYRGGGLWDAKPADYYKRKNDRLAEFMNEVLN